MKIKNILFPFLAAALICQPVASGWAASLSLSPSKTKMYQGESITVNIKIDQAQDITGAVFTFVYPSDVFELNGDNPVTTNFFQTFYDASPSADPIEIEPWNTETETVGVIKLSGAFIDTDATSGGGGAYSGEQTLFTIALKAKDEAPLGPAELELQQTMLCSAAAGWGTDLNENGQCDPGDTPEGSPILVKAYPIGSPQWESASLDDDVEVVLASFVSNPAVDIVVESEDFYGAGVALDMNTDTRDYLDVFSYQDIEATAPGNAGIGDEIWVAVVAQNVTNLDTYQVEVTFDPLKLDFLGGIEDNTISGIYNILKKNGGTTVGFQAVELCPDNCGVVNISNALDGVSTAVAPEGSGVLALLNFRVLNVASIGLSNVFFQDPYGVGEQITQLRGGGISACPWDFNKDGLEDYKDLGMFADHWLMTESDGNWDSMYNLYYESDKAEQIVNYLDLGVFADHWLSECN